MRSERLASLVIARSQNRASLALGALRVITATAACLHGMNVTSPKFKSGISSKRTNPTREPINGYGRSAPRRVNIGPHFGGGLSRARSVVGRGNAERASSFWVAPCPGVLGDLSSVDLALVEIHMPLSRCYAATKHLWED